MGPIDFGDSSGPEHLPRDRFLGGRESIGGPEVKNGRECTMVQ